MPNDQNCSPSSLSVFCISVRQPHSYREEALSTSAGPRSAAAQGGVECSQTPLPNRLAYLSLACLPLMSYLDCVSEIVVFPEQLCLYKYSSPITSCITLETTICGVLSGMPLCWLALSCSRVVMPQPMLPNHPSIRLCRLCETKQASSTPGPRSAKHWFLGSCPSTMLMPGWFVDPPCPYCSDGRLALLTLTQDQPTGICRGHCLLGAQKLHAVFCSSTYHTTVPSECHRGFALGLFMD